MPEKKRTVTSGTAEQKSPPQAADTAHGTPAEAGKEEPATGTKPAAMPAGHKSAAARMLTRQVAGKPPAGSRGVSQRVADAATPSQKPQAGGGRRGPRRGASKGR